jgi:hypothetical protein
VISQDQLVTKKQELEDNRQAKQVFYPRNLNVKDIEGTEVGSLNTKFMKNWALANNLKQQQGAREKLQVDIRYPYGDGINKEDYMPDNLRHAREMANLNRNKLRVMTNVERDPQTKQFFRGNNGQIDARDGGHQSDWHIDRQFPGSTPQQYYKQPEDIKSLEHQFSDGKEMYHKLRDLNCKNAPITYESSPQQNHELPNLGSRLPPDRSPYINQSSIPKEKIERRFESVSHPNLNNKLRGAINAGRDYQLPSINAREVGDRQPRDLEAKSNQELLSDIYKREQYLKDLDEQIKKEKEMLANLEQQELEYESQAKIDQGGATNNMSTNQRRYSQEEYEAYNRYLQEQGYNPNTYGSVPDARHGGYPQKGDPRRMPDYSSASPQPNRPDSDAYYRPSSQENRQVKDPRSPPTEVKVNPREVTFKGEPGKDMFRNTDEFNYFNK